MTTPPIATPGLPGTGLTTPKGRRPDIPRPVPLGGNHSAPNLMQSLDGIVTSMAAREQAAQDVAQDMLVAAERTSAMIGNVMERAATMMGMGVGQGGLPDWAAWAQSGMVGLGVGMPMVPAGSGASATFRPGMLPGTATQIHGIGAPPPNSGVPAVAPSGAADPTPPSAVPPVRLPGRGSGNVEGAVPRTAVPEPQPAQDGPPGPVWPHNFEQGKKFVTGDDGGFSLGGIRQNAARSINRRVSEWATSSEQTLVDDLGNPIRIDGKIQTRAVPRGTPETARGVVNLTDDGNMVADLAEGYTPTWREGLAANAKNIAGNMAEGQGLGEAITSAVPMIGKAAGIAGAVYTGVNMGLNFAEGQRSKNQEFQAMLGGANSEGFGERWKQNLFRLSLRGTMSGADAEAIYKGGVANYGNQQASRRQYESAAVNLYRSVGVSGDEAVSLLDQAAGRGNNNLYEFADAIREVSRAAKDAGEDARESRRYFQEAFASTSQFANGSAAIQGALGMANMRTALGDRFSDADFSGMDSPIQRRRMADLLDMDYPAFSAAMIRGGNEASTLLANGRSAIIQDAVRNIDPSGRMWLDATNQVKAAYEAGGDMDEAYTQIAADIQEKYGVDPMEIQSTASALAGQELTEDQAMDYFIRYGTDKRLDPATAEAERQARLKEAGKTLSLGYLPVDRKNAMGRPELGTGLWTKQDREAYDRAYNKYKRQIERGEIDPETARIAGTQAVADLHDKNREIMDKRIQRDFGDAVDINSTWYKDRMLGNDSFDLTGNRRDALKKAVLKEASQGNYYGLGTEIWRKYDKFGDKAMFQVDTADGKKAVNSTILVTEYGDQLQNNPNEIKVIGGENSGKSVGELLGTDNKGGDNTKTASGKTYAEPGTAEDVKDAKKKAGKADGTVIISPSPLLERMFIFTVDGAAEMATRRGEAPGASYEYPPTDRTGGN